MEVTVTQFLIICPMVFLAGLVDTIAGGGGLISLPAYLIAGISPHVALGTNKLSSLMGTAMSTAQFARKGYICLRRVIWFIVVSLIGSAIGSNLTLLVSEETIGRLMAVILPFVAFYVLKNKKIGDDSLAGTLSPRRSFQIALGSAFVVGMYDGFYGPGTGTFLILILTGAARYSMSEAAGTTKAINLASNVAAFVTFLLHGKVIWALGLTAGALSVLGNFIGSEMLIHGGQRFVRPLVLVVLAILFGKIFFG